MAHFGEREVFGQCGKSAPMNGPLPFAQLAAVRPGKLLFALGDAVCVPVIEWLAQYCLMPLLRQ